MFTTRKKLIIYVLSFPFVLIVGACIMLILTEIKNKAFSSLSVDNSIYSRIYKCHLSNGITYLVLVNKERYMFAPTYNYKYYPREFSHFVYRYDSIFKRKNSDTIYIFRNDEKYIFLLEQKLK